jgi:hypothetical protein
MSAPSSLRLMPRQNIRVENRDERIKLISEAQKDICEMN